MTAILVTGTVWILAVAYVLILNRIAAQSDRKLRRLLNQPRDRRGLRLLP
jgi:hypothetical protein